MFPKFLTEVLQFGEQVGPLEVGHRVAQVCRRGPGFEHQAEQGVWALFAPDQEVRFPLPSCHHLGRRPFHVAPPKEVVDGDGAPTFLGEALPDSKDSVGNGDVRIRLQLGQVVDIEARHHRVVPREGGVGDDQPRLIRGKIADGGEDSLHRSSAVRA